MHIISVAGSGLLTLYFLADSLVQRIMVVMIKMVANPAREAMAMRQVFAKLREEQVWVSVLGVVLGTSCGAVVAAGICVVLVGIGSLLGLMGMKVPAGLVETAETVVELAEAVESKTVEGSAVEVDPSVSVNSEVGLWVLVTETGRDVTGSSVLVVVVRVTVTQVAVIVVAVEAEGLPRFWVKSGA